MVRFATPELCYEYLFQCLGRYGQAKQLSISEKLYRNVKGSRLGIACIGIAKMGRDQQKNVMNHA